MLRIIVELRQVDHQTKFIPTIGKLVQSSLNGRHLLGKRLHLLLEHFIFRSKDGEPVIAEPQHVTKQIVEDQQCADGEESQKKPRSYQLRFEEPHLTEIQRTTYHKYLRTAQLGSYPYEILQWFCHKL